MPRHLGQATFRFAGDKALAKRYVSHARRVLGELDEVHQGATAAITREVAPGVIIRAQRAGALMIATITAGARSATFEGPIMAGFVFRPGPDDLPGEHDALLLSPLGDDRYLVWYPDTPSADGVRVPYRTYLQARPDGIEQFGNTDWRGESGLAVSWYGPRMRYWPDPVWAFTPMGRNTPKAKVFTQGYVLLDGATYVDEHAADPRCAWGVIGAWLRRDSEGALWLYAVHIDPAHESYASSWERSTYYSPLDPPELVEHVLVRYGVDTSEDVWTLTEDHTVEYSGNHGFDHTPWLASANGLVATRLGMGGPDHPRHASTEMATLNGLVHPDGFEEWSVQRQTFDDHPFVGTVGAASFERFPVATDWIGDTQVFMYADVQAPSVELYARLYTSNGSLDVVTYSQSFAGGADAGTLVHRAAFFVDLRYGIWAGVRREVSGGTFDPPWMTGAYQHRTEVIGPASAVGDADELLHMPPPEAPPETDPPAVLVEAGYRAAPAVNLSLVYWPGGSGALDGVNQSVAVGYATYYNMFTALPVTSPYYPRVVTDDPGWFGFTSTYRRRAMASFVSHDGYVNALTDATFHRATGIPGDAAHRFFPGTVVPRFFTGQEA